MAQIAGIAVVVAARMPVGLVAAAAQLQDHDAPAARDQLSCGAAQVLRPEAAGEAMNQHRKTRSAFGAGPGQIDEIAIRQFETLPPQRQRGLRPQQRRKDGLRMRAAQQRMRLEVAVDDTPM
jgi:hypothetical protein